MKQLKNSWNEPLNRSQTKWSLKSLAWNLCQYTPHDKVCNEVLIKELSLDEALRYSTSKVSEER